LLITPESLEAMLIRNAGWLKQAFAPLAYIAIDEFHAFIGSERGMQLLSLLNRIDHLLGRIDNPVPRVALSATLGNWSEYRYLCGQINVCPATLLLTVRLTLR
jgi:ATP-dependent Lhr-like helicase